MDNLTICGGIHTTNTCITFSSGKWVTSHALADERSWHCSWDTGSDIILLGGWDSSSTSETITQSEYAGEPGFALQYELQ